MAAKTIDLIHPITWFNASVARVILREPRAGHLQRFGEPRLSVFQTDGARFFVDRNDVIDLYFGELLSLDGEKPVEGGGGPLLTQLSLEDGIALRDALFDFFFEARSAISKRKPTSSSST